MNYNLSEIMKSAWGYRADGMSQSDALAQAWKDVKESTEALLELKKELTAQLEWVNARLEAKAETKKIIWSGACIGCATYHRGKYKHWAKVITSIDTSKKNGYAFQGTWLDYFSENEVLETAWILEYDCNYKYMFYQAGKGRETAIKGTYSAFVTFRNECVHAMK